MISFRNDYEVTKIDNTIRDLFLRFFDFSTIGNNCGIWTEPNTNAHSCFDWAYSGFRLAKVHKLWAFILVWPQADRRK